MMGDTTLVFSTWNVHGGVDRSGKPFDFIEECARTRPSVAGFQEFPLSANDERGALRVSARGLGLECTAAAGFSPSPFVASDQLAVALFTSLPKKCSEVYQFSNPVADLGMSPSFHNKGAVIGTLLLGEHMIDVVVLHLFPFHRVGVDPFAPFLRAFWREVDEFLSPRPGVPRVIMGDFNAVDRVGLLSCLREGHLRSLFDGVPSRDNGDSHDDILISGEWRALAADSTLSNSDHKLIQSRLRLPLPF